jgi:hypothetical protein
MRTSPLLLLAALHTVAATDIPATLSSKPSVITTDGEALLISWESTGIQPQVGDFVSVACGRPASLDDYLEDSFGGRFDVNASMSSVRTFPLINMRCNYLVRYVRGASVAASCLSAGKQNEDAVQGLTLLAEVAVPLAAGLAEQPTQGHIAYGDGDDEMWVMWTSASSAPSVVHWGLAPGDLEHTVVANASLSPGSYTNLDMCHAPANLTGQQNWIHPGQLHRVLLTGLPSDSTIYYRFGGDATELLSQERSFLTRLPALPRVRETRFIAYGDQDWDDPPPASATTMSNALRDALERGYRDFVLHFGDLSYAMGTGTDWEAWLRQNEPLATRVPYMVSIGNHEYDYVSGGERDPSGATDPDGYHPSWGDFGYDSHGECGVPVFHRFRSPTSGNGIFWYSFTHGRVHVIQISSEHDLAPGSPQRSWLEDDLAKADAPASRALSPWIVLTMHRMVYALTAQGGEGNTTRGLRASLEPLLRSRRVNLVLSGHQHSYERTCTVYDGVCLPPDQKGTVYITAGTGGAGLYKYPPNVPITGEYTVAATARWGYLRVEANEQRMRVAFVDNLSGGEYDEVVLPRWGA